MSKLIVELPEDLHVKLKTLAALSHRTIKDMIIELVAEYTARLASSPKLRDSGMCGSWTDQRSAESIISDIKAHRNWFGKGKKKNG